MAVREYQPKDCKEIIRLFYDTVHNVNAKDYTEEQLDVWATGKADIETWNRSLLEHYSLVALENALTGCMSIKIIKGRGQRLQYVINWSRGFKGKFLPMRLLLQDLSLKTGVIR